MQHVRILAVLLSVLCGFADAAETKPNVLVIIVDQLFADAMSCAGRSFVKTPAMDSLAATGARFKLAYCADPVCVPSRFSDLTVRDNRFINSGRRAFTPGKRRHRMIDSQCSSSNTRTSS